MHACVRVLTRVFCLKGERLRIPPNECCPECISVSQDSCRYDGAIFGVSGNIRAAFCSLTKIPKINVSAKMFMKKKVVYPESSCLMPRYGHSRLHCPQRLQLQTMADILQTEFYDSNETKPLFYSLKTFPCRLKKLKNIHMYLYIKIYHETSD